MPPIRFALLTGFLGTVAACLRFDPGNPPPKTASDPYHEKKYYLLGNERMLIALYSHPSNVIAEVIGPCQTDDEANQSVQIQAEIEAKICNAGTHKDLQFQITSPVRDFFELRTTCQNGRFFQVITGLCQLPPSGV